MYFTWCQMSKNFNVSHYKVTCNANSFISCGSSFLNCTSTGLPALHVGKPQLSCDLWAHEGVHCLFVNPWDISTIHLSLKVTTLSHKVIVYHLVCGNNMIWFGLQSQHLTLCLWHKYDLVCNTKLLSLFPTLGGFPHWVPPLSKVVPSVCLLHWYNSANYLPFLPQILFWLKYFVMKCGQLFGGATGFNAIATKETLLSTAAFQDHGSCPFPILHSLFWLAKSREDTWYIYLGQLFCSKTRPTTLYYEDLDEFVLAGLHFFAKFDLLIYKIHELKHFMFGILIQHYHFPKLQFRFEVCKGHFKGILYFLIEFTIISTIAIRINNAVKIHLHMILVSIWASQAFGNCGPIIIICMFDSHLFLQVLLQILEPCYNSTCHNLC